MAELKKKIEAMEPGSEERKMGRARVEAIEADTRRERREWRYPFLRESYSNDITGHSLNQDM